MVGAWEAIRWIALFRLALPGVILRYAGGREVTLRDLQAMGMTSGINALIVGNYLTTLGRSPTRTCHAGDLRMPVGALWPPPELAARWLRTAPAAAGRCGRVRRLQRGRSTRPGSAPTCGRRLAVAVRPAGHGGPAAATHGEIATGPRAPRSPGAEGARRSAPPPAGSPADRPLSVPESGSGPMGVVDTMFARYDMGAEAWTN